MAAAWVVPAFDEVKHGEARGGLCWQGTPKDSQHLRPWIESTTPRRDEIEPGESVASMTLAAHGPRTLTSSGDLARFPRSSLPSDRTRSRRHDEPYMGLSPPSRWRDCNATNRSRTIVQFRMLRGPATTSRSCSTRRRIVPTTCATSASVGGSVIVLQRLAKIQNPDAEGWQSRSRDPNSSSSFLTTFDHFSQASTDGPAPWRPVAAIGTKHLSSPSAPLRRSMPARHNWRPVASEGKALPAAGPIVVARLLRVSNESSCSRGSAS